MVGIYFLVYLFFEILFSYEFARVFTPFGLFLEIIFSAMVGIYVIKNLHFSFFDGFQKVLRREISEEEFVTAEFFKLIGAFLLIIPGIFSDIFGILFLFEPFGRWFGKKFFRNTTVYKKSPIDDDIIDVEIVEIIEEKKP